MFLTQIHNVLVWLHKLQSDAISFDMKVYTKQLVLLNYSKRKRITLTHTGQSPERIVTYRVDENFHVLHVCFLVKQKMFSPLFIFMQIRPGHLYVSRVEKNVLRGVYRGEYNMYDKTTSSLL